MMMKKLKYTYTHATSLSTINFDRKKWKLLCFRMEVQGTSLADNVLIIFFCFDKRRKIIKIIITKK